MVKKRNLKMQSRMTYFSDGSQVQVVPYYVYTRPTQVVTRDELVNLYFYHLNMFLRLTERINNLLLTILVRDDLDERGRTGCPTVQDSCAFETSRITPYFQQT